MKLIQYPLKRNLFKKKIIFLTLFMIIILTSLSADHSDWGNNLDISKIYTTSTLEKRYGPENMINRGWESWSEGVPGNGIGEDIIIEFSHKIELDHLFIKNGYGQLSYYYKNNRVKTLEIIPDNDTSGPLIEVEDSLVFEAYYLSEPLICSKIRLRIKDIYPGTEFDDTCIDEIIINQPVNSWGRSSILYYYLWDFRADPDSLELLEAIYKMEGVDTRVNEKGIFQQYVQGSFDRMTWENIPLSHTIGFYKPHPDGPNIEYKRYFMWFFPETPPLLLTLSNDMTLLEPTLNNFQFINSYKLFSTSYFVDSEWIPITENNPFYEVFSEIEDSSDVGFNFKGLEIEKNGDVMYFIWNGYSFEKVDSPFQDCWFLEEWYDANQ